MKICSKNILILFVLLLLICCSGVFAGGVNSVLEKMPAENSEQELLLAKELIDSGADPLSQVCEMIVPPGTGDDTSARYALSSLSFYVMRQENKQLQAMYADLLAKSLNKASDEEVKYFFITQLQLTGTDAQLGDIASYLSSDRLCDSAAMAMVTISRQSSEIYFLEALKSASKTNLPTIVRSLGKAQSKRAVEEISKYADSEDLVLRLVTIEALAEIGERKSARTIEKALEKADLSDKPKIASSYLRLGENLADAGHNWTAKGICKDILKNDDAGINSGAKSSALSLLVKIYDVDAMDYLVDAFDDGDGQLKYAAVTLAGGLTSSEVTEVWGKKISGSSPDGQILIIEMLAGRADKRAIPYIYSAYKLGGSKVKLATLSAIKKIDGAGAASYLAAAIDSDDGEFVSSVKSMLLQLPTDAASNAAMKFLPDVSAKGKVALIEVLAERRVKSSLDTVFAFTEDENAYVRLAAVKAAGTLGETNDVARVLGIALKSEKTTIQAEAARSIVKLCFKGEDPDGAAKPIYDSIDKSDSRGTVVFINILSKLGTDKAFGVVHDKTKSSDPEVKDAAIRGLAQWEGIEALDALLDIAKSTENITYNVLAVKGYVDITSKSGLPEDKKVEVYKNAISAAQRLQEKNFAISRLSQVRSISALRFAVSLLDEKSLNAAASNAVEKIVLPQNKRDKGFQTPGVAALLEEALGKIDDKEIYSRIDQYFKTLPKPKTKPSPKVSSEDSQTMKVPEGFKALFNGKDLTGWKGLLARPYDNPIKRAALSKEELALKQAEADELMKKHWKVIDGVLCFDGEGFSLATDGDFGDFVLLVDWKLLQDNGDSGIYLRGSPQVQIWDPAHWKVGSGGLYNNKKNPSKPNEIADKPIGNWNRFEIEMIGEKVSVRLNGVLVVDKVTLENYWDRTKPIFATGQIELQCHGNPVCFRNIFVREIPRKSDI